MKSRKGISFITPNKLRDFKNKKKKIQFALNNKVIYAICIRVYNICLN